jgi:hypothetical protein
MPAASREFTTLQRSGPYAQNPDAVWSIIPQSKAGRGGLTPHQYAIKNYGMTWTEMRSVINYMITSPVGDNAFADQMKERIAREGYVPVRSTELLDTILRTLFIDRSSWYSSHFYVDVNYEWPVDRPPFIMNPAHTFGKGRGKYYRPIHPLAQARQNLIGSASAKGYATYGLNDPKASSDPRYFIDQSVGAMVEDDFANIFNFVIGVKI